MITKTLKQRSFLQKIISASSQRQFSQLSTSESEDTQGEIRPKINPRKKEVTDFLKNVSQYEEQVQDVLNPYYYETSKLKGFATDVGTDTFYRMSQYDDPTLDVHPDNFKSPFNSNIKLSSIGYGTYMGDPDDYTDYRMYDSIKTSVLSGGVNHIDTAPNYRYMKSEKTVGKILTTLDNKYGIKRNQMFISTKAGYIPEDADKMISRTEMTRRMIEQFGVPEKEIVAESSHCIHPKFLDVQLNESLDRLNLESVDVYYLHNPYEAQGPYNTDNVVFDRLTAAFEFLEGQVQKGKIQNYGIASYSCFRTKPTDDKMHLELQRVVRLAEKVGGEKTHHMRYVQVPINILMPEAFTEPWQSIENNGVTRKKMLAAVCTDLEINLISSQPLLQGFVANTPLSRTNIGVFNIPARHLQLMRSIPSKALKSTLVGMKDPVHVRANLEVIKKPLMTREDFFETLKPHRRSEYIEEELEM